MEDYRQAQKEYQRFQREIRQKRAAKAGELVRGVMKRMGQTPSPFWKVRPRPIDPTGHLNDYRTVD